MRYAHTHTVFISMCLRTYSDYFSIQHWLVFNNREGDCLLRGADWVYLKLLCAFSKAVTWPRRLVAGLSPRRRGFVDSPGNRRCVVDKVALGQVFPYRYHSNTAPHLYFSTCCSYQRDKRAKPGNLPKRSDVLVIAERGIERDFYLTLKS